MPKRNTIVEVQEKKLEERIEDLKARSYSIKTLENNFVIED